MSAWNKISSFKWITQVKAAEVSQGRDIRIRVGAALNIAVAGDSCLVASRVYYGPINIAKKGKPD